MMKKVCLMVGHWGIENITQDNLRSWRSATTLKSSTGASGERDWHWNEWMPRLRDKLIQTGIQVFIAGATYQPETYTQEYDLWLSAHYDGGGTGERCMASAPNRETKPSYLNEGAFANAERFCQIWKNLYSAKVGVPFNENLITAGMKDYYAFDYVGFDTPAVIVEHFNHTSPRGNELKQNPELVAQADFEVICQFLEIQSIPAENVTLEGLKKAIETYQQNFGDLNLVLKLPEGNKDFALIQQKCTELMTIAINATTTKENHQKFVEKVAEGIGCADKTETGVLEALVDLEAHIKYLETKRLEEFGAIERIMSGLGALFPKIGK